jgi:hypothetical protein
MFDTALIRPHGRGSESVDAGMLAETLMFYDKVHVAADRPLLGALLKVIHPQDFLNLVKTGHIRLSYSKYSHGVSSTKTGFFEEHSFISFALAKTANGKRITKTDEIRTAVTSVMGFNRASRKTTEELIEKTVFVDRSFPIGHSIEIAHAELDDDDFLRPAIAALISILVPTFRLPNDWKFKPYYIGRSLALEINLDFDAINIEYHKYVPETHSSITPAYLLGFILSARMDATMAADYMAEIVTKDEVSKLIRLKISAIVKRREKSLREIDIFQETVLNDCRKVREAINSGERTFAEFMPVLEKATQFKKWLANQNPDANLLTEYYKSITASGPMNSLPGKTMRYVAVSLAGIAGLIPGLALGAADEFFVDKFFKGWRPNHFIEGPLRNFTSAD